MDDGLGNAQLCFTARTQFVPVYVGGPGEISREGSGLRDKYLSLVHDGPLKDALVQDICQLGVIAT